MWVNLAFLAPLVFFLHYLLFIDCMEQACDGPFLVEVKLYMQLRRVHFQYFILITFLINFNKLWEAILFQQNIDYLL